MQNYSANGRLVPQKQSLSGSRLEIIIILHNVQPEMDYYFFI